MSMHLLPRNVFEKKFGQKYAPFGTEFIKCGDGTTVGVESCEEVSQVLLLERMFFVMHARLFSWI